jgi:STE24 endopeptidase
MKRSVWLLPFCLALLFGSLWLSYAVYTDTSGSTEVAAGSPAHPLSFMSEGEWERTVHYSRTKDALYFASTGFQWVALLFVMIAGLSARMREAARRVFRNSTFGQVTVYVALFEVVTSLLELPLDWYRHVVDVQYGISTMTAGAWLQELLLDVAVGTVVAIPVVWLALLIVRKSPQRWWVWFWAALLPLLVLMAVLQPLVLDPLYNDFRPLQDQALKERILDLAHQANIPSDDVYEVDMSKKTNALNAYVTGLGPSARIVLWDTTLKKLQDDEILFVMGHEMGHYVKYHVVFGLAGEALLLLAMLFALATGLRAAVRWFGESLGVESMQDLAALPLALALFSMLSFAAAPLQNYVQRVHEHVADQYAVEITKDPEAGVRSFQKLARLSLSDPNPPLLVKVLRYSHPTISERIQFLEQFRSTKDRK